MCFVLFLSLVIFENKIDIEENAWNVQIFVFINTITLRTYQVNFSGYLGGMKYAVTSARDTMNSTTTARSIFWDAETGLDLEAHDLNTRCERIFAVSNKDEPAMFAKVDGTGYVNEPWKLKLLAYPDFKQVKSIQINDADKQWLARPDWLRFSPDDKELWVGLLDWFKQEEGYSVMVWDIASGKKLRSFDNAGSKKVKPLAFGAFGGDSKNIIVVADEDDKAVYVVSTATGKQVWASGKDMRNLRPDAVCGYPDGKHLAVCATRHNPENTSVFVFSTDKQEAVAQFSVIDGYEGKCINVSKDGKLLGVASEILFALYSTSNYSLVCRFVNFSSVVSFDFNATKTAAGCVQLMLAYQNGDVKFLRLTTSQDQVESQDSLADKRAAIEAQNEQVRFCVLCVDGV